MKQVCNWRWHLNIITIKQSKNRKKSRQCCAMVALLSFMGRYNGVSTAFLSAIPTGNTIENVVPIPSVLSTVIVPAFCFISS